MIHFLTLSEVLTILQHQIRDFGGIYGVRDLGLLSSAIYMPESGFNGEYFHKTIPSMAAAYAFHICQNHPFIDGNKRTALTSSLSFLDINKYTFNYKEKTAYKKIMKVAIGELKKRELIRYYETHSTKK
ncbi:MAG: type II toxin-antitoxin system death-on-curing family toxin [Clostridiales bacterium]|jgi:death-on-curing protein|nr:type II toxin-antitoxin system death-on-curing family toxin [Clostridiales bacterium]